jgi:hypothetical protein
VFTWVGVGLHAWAARTNHPNYLQVVNSLQVLAAAAGALAVNLDRVPGQP